MNLFVGNLSPETTLEDLRKAFQAHGTVDSATLLTTRMKGGRRTGPSRGKGFVAMPDPVMVEKACAYVIPKLGQEWLLHYEEAKPWDWIKRHLLGTS